MRGFLAVLRREVAERWLIAVAALLLGLAPLLAPLLPLGPHLQGPDIRGGTAPAERFDPRRRGVREIGNPHDETKTRRKHSR